MEVKMMRRKMSIAALLHWVVIGSVALFGLASHSTAFADNRLGDGGRSTLAVLLDTAKISLQQGLAASEQQGQPISAKFEVEDGKLHLSVYTMKDGKFFETLVDHMTGTVTKTEPITEGEDLAQAKAQSAALTKARIPLKEAIDRVVAQTEGARAVSAIPDLKDGRAVASVAVLIGGRKLERSAEPLD
jgi:uncharacterized membrane protein YkoI